MSSLLSPPSHIISTKEKDVENEEGRLLNKEAVAKIRDAWINKQLRSRQDEFTTYRDTSVFTGTWNVNAKKFGDTELDEDPLRDWLYPKGAGGEVQHDIVAVAFQEIVDLNAVNVAMDSQATKRSIMWQEALSRCLSGGGAAQGAGGKGAASYTLVSEVHLVGMLLCVYVKAAHAPRVQHVHSQSVGVGVMGMMGNKGGVSIRFSFYDSTVCFVCSHFAAHRENVVGRNADFATIVQRTSFEVGPTAIKEIVQAGSLAGWGGSSNSVGILDHDFVFWLGDLNYRIDETMSTEEVFTKANTNDIKSLRPHDQLNIERQLGNVFQGFEEGVINFPPTYKYQPGTDLYEARPDKKLRAPAWCDRVLWTAQQMGHIKQLCYSRSELNISDHKPVYATFTKKTKGIIPAKRSEVYQEIMRTLDKFENQSLPKVDLDKSSVDFGDVFYEGKVSENIVLTNTGKVVAHFRLVPKLEEDSLCKPWITVSPSFGMLIPGESASISFSINIDNKTAKNINAGLETIEDILILRLENGRDYYLTVAGNYSRSCFGMSLPELVMFSGPVRSVPLDAAKRLEYDEAHPPAALSVPKELWRIVDAIYEKGLLEKDLFLVPGVGNEVKQIREALDSSTDFGPYHVHSMAESLVSFLSSLSSPVVPPTLFPALKIDDDQQSIQSWSRRFLEELPPISYNVFVYIISFFREILQYAESNKLTAQKLARVGCTCMLNADTDTDSASRERNRSMSLIFLHFLTTNSV